MALPIPAAIPSAFAWLKSFVTGIFGAAAITGTWTLGNVIKVLVLAKITKVLIGLGVGWVTYEVTGFGADVVYQKFQSIQGSIPADALNILALMGVFEAVSIMISALSVALSIRGYRVATNSWSGWSPI